jgi:hypothetical protein
MREQNMAKENVRLKNESATLRDKIPKILK